MRSLATPTHRARRRACRRHLELWELRRQDKALHTRCGWRKTAPCSLKLCSMYAWPGLYCEYSSASSTTAMFLNLCMTVKHPFCAPSVDSVAIPLGRQGNLVQAAEGAVELDQTVGELVQGAVRRGRNDHVPIQVRGHLQEFAQRCAIGLATAPLSQRLHRKCAASHWVHLGQHVGEVADRKEGEARALVVQWLLRAPPRRL